MPPVPSAYPGMSCGMWGPSTDVFYPMCLHVCVCACPGACLCRRFRTWPGCGGAFPCEEILNLRKLWTFSKCLFSAFYVLVLIMSTVPTNSCTVLPDFSREHIHTTQLKLQMYCTSLPLYSPSYHFTRQFYFSLRTI